MTSKCYIVFYQPPSTKGTGFPCQLNMKVLIACEYSGSVRDAFIKRGYDAISCDLLQTEVPGPHYQGSVLDILDHNFDLMIAHPPCTHLAVSGARWFKEKQKEQKDALKFVQILLNAPIKHIALENPVSIISSKIRKPDQIVQPWMFGDSFHKTTCLWLKNLPKLEPTNVVDKGEFFEFQDRKTGKKKRQPMWYAYAPRENRGKLRSKTFQGLADAMADQWGQFISSNL